jgi:hypothetical protein
MKLAKSINELAKNRWYRILRIAFVFSFVTAQAIGFLLIRNRTERTVIAPISFKLVGKALKEDMNAFGGMSDEEAGRSAYRKDPALWDGYVEEYRKKYVIDPITRYREYSEIQQTQFLVTAFLAITLFFEVIRRSFYYVIFGKIFPRKRRRRRRKGEPESAEIP